MGRIERRAGWAVGSDCQATLDPNTGGYWYKKRVLIILVIRYAGLVLCSLDGHFGMGSELSFVKNSSKYNARLSCNSTVQQNHLEDDHDHLNGQQSHCSISVSLLES